MGSPKFMIAPSPKPAATPIDVRRRKGRPECPRPRLRYVDLFLKAFEDGTPDCAEALGRNLHWGYHEDSAARIGSAAEFARAGDAMSARVIDAAKLRAGDAVLDAGCGFGGTLGQLNALYSSIKLTGLNIDPRQILRARSHATDHEDATIRHVCADAREMPFADGSFDAVLALELTCHLEDRPPFFAEANRVLRQGGRLIVADYAVSGPMRPIASAVDFCVGQLFTRVYGRLNCKLTLADYRKLAEARGFDIASAQDLTRNTLPNYRFLRRILRSLDISFGEKRFNDFVGLAMENAARMGALKYFLLTLIRR